ncbi:MerR family transcriptional regulator [Paenibacillus sp. MMO-58]|uniref:MerR family transcriptional regulator n=1 Tax=Paenibacillus sp. MMO-58 TaxID=3081290 RepID=UPI00301AD08E
MKRYTSKEVADLLGIEAVTVRKYSLALEKFGYNVERSDGKNRDFSERDVMALKYLQTIRARTSITVDEAAQLVANRELNDMHSESNIVRSVEDAFSGDIIKRYETRYSELERSVEQFVTVTAAQLKQLQETYATEAIRLAEEHRLQQINDRIAERRVIRQLEREALQEWQKKPLTERMRKVGLFRKEEDLAARELFVRDYVDERFDQQLREALS